MNAKVLMIAGMHRSGTSVVAQWLQKCGLFIGGHLLGAGIGNSQGHFEDADFLAVHEKLLRKHHLVDTGFINRSVSGLTEKDRDELRLLLADKCSKNAEWGWKEPRTCLFLNEYGKLLPHAFYMIVVRNYNDTVNSLVMRDYRMIRIKGETKRGVKKIFWKLFKQKSLEQLFKQKAEKYLKVWIHYNEEILNHVSLLPGEKYVIVNFSQLLFDDESVLATCTDEWNFSLDYYPFRKIYNEHFLSGINEVDKYIRNKSLVERAKHLQERLRLKYGVKM
ncbi:MAG: hypothetical protein QM725_05610 [Lacibacter sp.]